MKSILVHLDESVKAKLDDLQEGITLLRGKKPNQSAVVSDAISRAYDVFIERNGEKLEARAPVDDEALF